MQPVIQLALLTGTLLSGLGCHSAPSQRMPAASATVFAAEDSVTKVAVGQRVVLPASSLQPSSFRRAIEANSEAQEAEFARQLRRDDLSDGVPASLTERYLQLRHVARQLAAGMTAPAILPLAGVADATNQTATVTRWIYYGSPRQGTVMRPYPHLSLELNDRQTLTDWNWLPR